MVLGKTTEYGKVGNEDVFKQIREVKTMWTNLVR